MPQWEYCSIQFVDDGLAYFVYRAHGLDSYNLYQGTDQAKIDNLTGQYVGTLGLHGWEAIDVIRLSNGIEHWYFKRHIHPSNQYLF